VGIKWGQAPESGSTLKTLWQIQTLFKEVNSRKSGLGELSDEKLMRDKSAKSVGERELFMPISVWGREKVGHG
jgi:hypothetical protein